MCDILRWLCNIVRHRATSSYILLCLDLIYTNINAKGHATMILSNIRMCMQFAKNVQFISCCNLTYAYVMRLSWVSHASGGKHFNIAILHDVHAILCKFHKLPLRLPCVLCSCPAIATRHTHDQSEYHTTPLDFCFILPIFIKRCAHQRVFFIWTVLMTPRWQNCCICVYEDASISTLSQLNSDKYVNWSHYFTHKTVQMWWSECFQVHRGLYLFVFFFCGIKWGF